MSNLAKVTYKVPPYLPHQREPYRISALQTRPSIGKDKPKLVCFTGFCQSPQPYAAFGEAFSEYYDVTIASVCGVDIGAPAPASLEDLAEVCHQLIKTLGYADREYEAAGQSFGAMNALDQYLTDRRPSNVTMVQGFLKNNWTTDQLIGHVLRNVGGYSFLDMGWHNKGRMLIKKGTAAYNWLSIKRNGTARGLVSQVCDYSYARRPIHEPVQMFVSKYDELFSPAAKVEGLTPLQDAQTGLPKATIVELKDSAFKHAWLQFIDPKIACDVIRGKDHATLCPVRYQIHPAMQVAEAAMIIGALGGIFFGARRLFNHEKP